MTLQADYKDIDHRYGTLEDVDRLIAELKKRGMRLVMDLVRDLSQMSSPLLT